MDAYPGAPHHRRARWSGPGAAELRMRTPRAISPPRRGGRFRRAGKGRSAARQYRRDRGHGLQNLHRPGRTAEARAPKPSAAARSGSVTAPGPTHSLAEKTALSIGLHEPSPSAISASRVSQCQLDHRLAVIVPAAFALKLGGPAMLIRLADHRSPEHRQLLGYTSGSSTPLPLVPGILANFTPEASRPEWLRSNALHVEDGHRYLIPCPSPGFLIIHHGDPIATDRASSSSRSAIVR